MRVVTVVGARPQFVKAAALARALAARAPGEIDHKLVHTGQHWDDNMSRVFFDELELPAADVNLGIGGGGHGAMTGAMLAALEPLFVELAPDWVLVYGDTNSTLAAALAAAKLHLPVAHVEAGLRSWNRRMPEEVNRVLVDHVASALFCPSEVARDNLAGEGITRGVHVVGDVMLDATLHHARLAASKSPLAALGLEAGGYYLATCHRAENTDDPARLEAILAGLAAIGARRPVVFPVHPRTRAVVAARGLDTRGIRLVDPVGHLDMTALEAGAHAVLTDSGGVQKEAYFLGVPCITLRDETEWVETTRSGWNVLASADTDRIVRAAEAADAVRALPRPALYGTGDAAARIVATLLGEGS